MGLVLPSGLALLYQLAIKKTGDGAGEMDQWLRSLAALSKDIGSVPNTYMAAHNGL